MTDELRERMPLNTALPFSDAMRTLVASMTPTEIETLLERLSAAWGERVSNPAMGNYFVLLWNAANRILRPQKPDDWHLLKELGTSSTGMDNSRLSRLDLSTDAFPADLRGVNFKSCELETVTFAAASLEDASFQGALLEAVSFRDAELSGANFRGAMLIDVDVAGAHLKDADFRGTDPSLTLIIEDTSTTTGRRWLEGREAIGYLAFNGALTDEIDAYSLWSHHPCFSIVKKISTKLVEGSLRQRRGLELRGAASQNPQFARNFVRFLETASYLKTPLGRPELVAITPSGRTALGHIHAGEGLSEPIASFLDAEHRRMYSQ